MVMKKIMRIETTKEGVVKAGDIIHDADVEILNPDLKIATLSDNARLVMEITASRGRDMLLLSVIKKVNILSGLSP